MTTLSEITRRYFWELCLADTRKANPLFDLLVRDRALALLPSRQLGKTAIMNALRDYEMNPTRPRLGFGVTDEYRPFTYQNCFRMLAQETEKRGGVTPSCWYVSKDCGKELVDSLRASHIHLRIPSGEPTGALPTDDDFEDGQIKIMGVTILPAFVTEKAARCHEPLMDGMLVPVPRVEVTRQMLDRGELTARSTGLDCQSWAPETLHELLSAVYPAMASVAPVPLVSEAEDKVTCLQAAYRSLGEASDARIAELEMENARLRRLLASDAPGDHPYHGPLSKPDENGKRTPVPDETHERFHKSIGDVLSGKILPKAREQMADALKRSPPDAPTTASTSKPMPGKALGLHGDPRRLGLA